MAEVYGNIVTTSDAARFLKDMNRDYYGRKTWEQAFGNIDLAEQQQIGSLGYDYSKAIGEAYAAAYKNKQGIMASNLGQGYKEQAMISNEEALNQAFETYRQNYLSGVSKVETEANKARTELGEQLNTQAENVAKLMNAPFGSEDKEGYIQWLFGQADTDEKLKTYIESNPTFERYFKETDTGKELKDSYELRQMLRDEQGYLSKEGTNVYDQLFNLGSTVGDKYSFGRWLAESDKDLYDWATNSDVYNFTAAGTNLGTIKELVGMSSTDQVYDYADIIAGIPQETIEEYKTNLEDKYNKLVESVEKLTTNYNEMESAQERLSKSWKEKRDEKRNEPDLEQQIKSINENTTSLIDELENTVKMFGIEDMFGDSKNNEITEMFKQLKSNLNEWTSKIKVTDDLKEAQSDINNVTAFITGATGGSFFGPIGTLVGGITSWILSLTTSLIKSTIRNKEYNEKVVKESKEGFKDFEKMYNEFIVLLSNIKSQGTIYQ